MKQKNLQPKDYHRRIDVNVRPEEAYKAITEGYSQWWTECEGIFGHVGDRIRFTFPPNVSYWVFEARVLEPNKKVVLECVEAYHKILDKPEASETEWLGSRLIWGILPSKGNTTIDLTHEGLTPSLDCFEVCEAGWNHFFTDSLKSYLNDGLGKPSKAG